MNETTTKLPHLGGGYLKHGDIKPNRDGTSQHVKCQVSARNGGPRVVPAHGKFAEAIEIPLNMDGMPKVLSLPSSAGDIEALKAVFGPLENWAGRTVDVFESDLFRAVRIAPVG